MCEPSSLLANPISDSTEQIKRKKCAQGYKFKSTGSIDIIYPLVESAIRMQHL